MMVLVAYLALTAVLLPLGGAGLGRVLALIFHLGTAAALLALPAWAARGRFPRVLADWLPLLLVPLLYAELPLLMEGLPGPVTYHDPAIAGLEGFLFGTQPAYAWAGAWPLLPLSELLHACYVSYYPLIYTPPLFVYLGMSGRARVRGAGPAYSETVLAVVLAFLLCFLVFIVFPVQGPRYLGVPAGVPDGPVRRLALLVLQGASSRGAAFPSSHVSVALAQAALALRHQPRVGRWTLAVAVGLAAGAVYGGFHYGVDALSGAAVGLVAARMAGPLRRRLEGPDAGFTSAPDAA
ncbi:MAG: phosphatase PAP2 family protein [Gemmatimonadetes bacterium]|nr:phosphatase PAP2 family protein [Gemmatimonadota bacterium]